MSTTKYADLLTEILPKLPADPSDPVTENAIKRAVTEFCSRSWVWKYLADPLDVVAGEATYEAEPAPGADVARVMSVSYDGQRIENVSIEWLDSNHPGWRTEMGTPRYFTQVDPEQIILAPGPNTTGAEILTMTLALQPDARSTAFPKWIANKYIEVIVHGTIARLMLMPKKDWTDLQLGAEYKRLFNVGIADAREDAVVGLGRAPSRVASHH